MRATFEAVTHFHFALVHFGDLLAHEQPAVVLIFFRGLFIQGIFRIREQPGCSPSRHTRTFVIHPHAQDAIFGARGEGNGPAAGECRMALESRFSITR